MKPEIINSSRHHKVVSVFKVSVSSIQPQAGEFNASPGIPGAFEVLKIVIRQLADDDF